MLVCVLYNDMAGWACWPHSEAVGEPIFSHSPEEAGIQTQLVLAGGRVCLPCLSSARLLVLFCGQEESAWNPSQLWSSLDSAGPHHEETPDTRLNKFFTVSLMSVFTCVSETHRLNPMTSLLLKRWTNHLILNYILSIKFAHVHIQQTSTTPGSFSSIDREMNCDTCIAVRCGHHVL